MFKFFQYKFIYKSVIDFTGSFRLRRQDDEEKAMPSPYADHDHIRAKALSGQRQQVRHDRAINKIQPDPSPFGFRVTEKQV